MTCEYSRAKRVGRPRHPYPSSKRPQSNPGLHGSVAGTSSTSYGTTAGPAPLPAEGRFTGPETPNDPDSSWLLPPFGPDLSDEQPLDASQWYLPCLVQHGTSSNGAFLNDDASLETDLVPPLCRCRQDVAQYFTKEEPPRTLDRVQSLRQAMDVAEKVLQCAICFDVARGDASISKNIVLLGALMSDIAASYGHLLFRIRAVGASIKDGQENSFEIVFGLQTQPNPAISTTVPESTYQLLLRSAITEDLGRLSTMCRRFETRQMKAHELGHEACEPAHPCRYGQKEPASATSKYIDMCPRSVNDPKRAFTCFRTVDQVSAAIRDTHRILDKWRSSAIESLLE